jgi:gluconate kinase
MMTTSVVHRSFREQLREAADAALAVNAQDPWEPVLRQIKGRIGHDGVQRVSTTDLFDQLEVPMRRRQSLTVRLSRVMRKLGWTNIRARGLNRGSYRDRVRGFAREVGGHPATAQLPNDF